MVEHPLNIVVAAETIPALNCGLGYFLFNGITKLAAAKPSWQFTVVAPSSFKELSDIHQPNIKILYWDLGFLRRTVISVLKTLMPSTRPDITEQFSFAVSLLSRRMPFRRMRASMGDLKSIYGSFKNVDLVWMPHYSIIQPDQFAASENLSTVACPILLTMHDIHPVFFPDSWSRESMHSFWNSFVPFARNCKRIMTHSEFQKEMMVKHLGINPEVIKVVSIPSLIDFEIVNGKSSSSEIKEVLERFGITAPFVFYPGAGGHIHKNHMRLFMAWAELYKTLGSTCPTLVCTTKGHLWPALKEQINALGISDKVIFTDTVDTDTLIKLYAGCAFVIVPTLFEGGGSGPVVEALLAGKPVACSNIAPILEQLRALNLDLAERYLEFFDPLSVDSIVRTTLSVINRLPELESREPVDGRRVLIRMESLWGEWTSAYTEQMMELTAKESERRL